MNNMELTEKEKKLGEELVKATEEQHYVRCPACGKKVHIDDAVITTRKGENGIFIYHSNPICMSKMMREQEAQD